MAAPEMGSTREGQAIYSPLVLKTYDLWVLGLSNHLLWRCPTAKLRALYDHNVSANHLDVGVGTGYFLKNAVWPSSDPKITLLDLNPNSLEAAAKRIAGLKPQTVKADVLQPLPEIGPFQSVGVCYLLHCLPGTMSQKAILFDHLLEVMAPGAKLFGATILQGNAPRSWPAQKLMDLYNRRGIFSNTNDTLETLQCALASRFEGLKIETSGCVALFSAKKS